jgi:hypothetical protein
MQSVACSAVLPFCRSAVLPFCRSAVLPFALSLSKGLRQASTSSARTDFGEPPALANRTICRLLAAGCWLLAAGCWLLAAVGRGSPVQSTSASAA